MKRSGRLLFLPLSVRWMRGETQEERSQYRLSDILEHVWHMRTISNIKLTSLVLLLPTSGVPQTLKYTHAKEIKTAADDDDQIRMVTLNPPPLLHVNTGCFVHTCIHIHKNTHTHTHTHACAVQRLRSCTKEQRDDTILWQRQAGWWIRWIHHPACLIRTSVTEFDRMKGDGDVEGSEQLGAP